MKAISRLLFLAFIAFASFGCDSKEATDAEKIVGTWKVNKLYDGVNSDQDKSALFTAAINSFTASFTATGTYSLSLDVKTGTDTNVPAGTAYTLNPASYGLNLTFPTSATTSLTLPFKYKFVSDTQIELSIAQAVLAGLGTTFQPFTGTLRFIADKQ